MLPIELSTSQPHWLIEQNNNNNTSFESVVLGRERKTFPKIACELQIEIDKMNCRPLSSDGAAVAANQTHMRTHTYTNTHVCAYVCMYVHAARPVY